MNFITYVYVFSSNLKKRTSTIFFPSSPLSLSSSSEPQFTARSISPHFFVFLGRFTKENQHYDNTIYSFCFFIFFLCSVDININIMYFPPLPSPFCHVLSHSLCHLYQRSPQTTTDWLCVFFTFIAAPQQQCQAF